MAGKSPDERPDDTESRSRLQRDYVRHASLGFEFLAAVGGLAWLGWLLDGWLGIAQTFPAFLLLGTFLGLGLAIYRLMLKTGQIRKDDDE